MKKLDFLDENRIAIFGDKGDEYNGMFEIKVQGEKWRLVVSNGGEWEHVSVSHKHKTPSWKVMNTIKDLIFEEDEVVMQLHPPKSEYVNNHDRCLHLWRPINQKIPTPPSWMVGIKGLEFKPK